MPLKAVSMVYTCKKIGYGFEPLRPVAIVLCLKMQWLLLYTLITSGYGSIPITQVVLFL